MKQRFLAGAINLISKLEQGGVPLETYEETAFCPECGAGAEGCFSCGGGGVVEFLVVEYDEAAYREWEKEAQFWPTCPNCDCPYAPQEVYDTCQNCGILFQ